MPRFLEKKLEARAEAMGKTGRAADRYVYGAMNNMGAMKGNQPTAKGERMQAKHERDMNRKRPDGDRLGSGSHGFRTHKK